MPDGAVVGIGVGVGVGDDLWPLPFELGLGLLEGADVAPFPLVVGEGVEAGVLVQSGCSRFCRRLQFFDEDVVLVAVP